MFVILSLLFFAVILVLWRYLAQTRQLLRELEGALRAKQRYLPEVSDRTLSRCGIAGVIEQANELIQQDQDYSDQNTGYSTQVEALLCAVQEVVVIFNSDRVVEFANKSAEGIFREGRSLKGLRLDSVLRSLSLLELLEQQDESVGQRQISVEHQGQTLWFEASFAKVGGIAASRSQSTLLVLHDITQLKHLEVMRREFVANVSHELRTPLTIIKGFAETLVEDAATIPIAARLRFLGKILKNAERLHVLVEDLLNLSRLESQPDQLQLESQGLKPLLHEILEDYRPRLQQEAGQRMRVDFDPRVGDFVFDRYQLRQVWDNLVVNVFRYAPDFNELVLQVSYQPEQDVVLCTVQDDGPGIPAVDLPHIFERFYRVEKGRSSEHGGTGLGLSIVKHIVQLHGGTISAESEPGRGTRVQFTLPYQQQIPAPVGLV